MISILATTCNFEKYIKKCIRSVISQTVDDWEMIIVDDMSTDQTRSIIRSFVTKDKRIRFYPAPRKLYCGSAYDLAASYAKGDVIGVLDGDDMLVSDALEIIRGIYDQNLDIDYVYTQHWTCNKHMKKIRKGISSLPIRGMDLLQSWKNKVHAFSHWRTCRSFMLQYDIFRRNLQFSVDKYMGMMLETHGTGGFLDIPLYLYRTYPGQLTTKLRKHRKVVNQNCVDYILAYRDKYGLQPKKIRRLRIEC